MPNTYAEQQLTPLGFETTDYRERSPGYIDALTMELGGTAVKFECACPFYPTVKAMGCALHHEGPGGSWPIKHAADLALSKSGE